ncbi:MAG: hypothetical protein WDZ59_07140 [Pirellulales bacterium]
MDEIVVQHGIIDVLSSIATNEYFESEPLVGAINKGHKGDVTIIEGNRRLTACLVLAGDDRAGKYGKLRAQHRNSKINRETTLPVQVYDWSKKSHRARLLPYLGVRHIVGAQQWDSYAKAAWVVETLKASELSLDNIKGMIGDDQNFTDRIVEGYHFVRQLVDTKTYDVQDSLRKGRGSFQQFPFSWVYTALGYRNMRRFVGLPQESVTRKNPIQSGKLNNAAQLMIFMFGGRGKNAAIDDSRQIGSLASVITNRDAVAVLKNGGDIEDARDVTRPPEERLIELLQRADKALAVGIEVASGIGKLQVGDIADIRDIIDRITSRIDSFVSLLGSRRKRPGKQGRGAK